MERKYTIEEGGLGGRKYALQLPLDFVPGSRLFLYDIFVWTTEQSPREQQLAVAIYNVCFLVLGEFPHRKTSLRSLLSI